MIKVDTHVFEVEKQNMKVNALNLTVTTSTRYGYKPQVAKEQGKSLLLSLPLWVLSSPPDTSTSSSAAS